MQLVIIPEKIREVGGKWIPESLVWRLISNTIDFRHDKSYKVSIATSHNYAQDFSVVTKLSPEEIVKNSDTG